MAVGAMNGEKLPTWLYVTTGVIAGIVLLVTFCFLVQLFSNGRVTAIFSDSDYKCGAVRLMAQKGQVPIVTTLYKDVTEASTMINNCDYRPASFQYGAQTCTRDSVTRKYLCKGAALP